MSQDPNDPPKAKVDRPSEHSAFDFQPNAPYSFSPRQLWQTGVFSILNLFLMAALISMAWQPEAGRGLNPLMLLVLWSQSVLSLYILWMLKKLLKEKSHFHAANLAISLMMLLTLLAAIVDPFLLQQDQASSNTLNLIEIILNGALLLYLGVSLLRCPDPLYGDLKLIAYLHIAAGICYMSVIWIFLGLVFSIPLAIYTARLFFRASLAMHKAAN